MRFDWHGLLFAVFCTLLASPAVRADVIGVDPPVLVNTTSGDNATMAIPRWKGYLDPADPSRFWVMHAGFSSGATNIVFSEDGGDTWNDTGMQAIENGYLDYHAAMFGSGSDFYVTAPSGGAIRAVHWAAPARSNDDRRTVVTIPATDGGHRSSTMVDGDGRWWVFTRRSDLAAENVKYACSNDQGATWTYGTAYATNHEDVRFGSMPGHDGAPLLFVLYLMSERGYEYYKWNGLRFVAMPDHSIWPEYVGWDRFFTHNLVGDAIHLIFRDGERLRHVWKRHDAGQGVWLTSIVPTTASAEIDPVCTVRGQELYLFYSLRTNDADPATAQVRAIVWNQETLTWGPEIAVSTGATTHNTLPNTCFHVPTTCDYVPVFWNAGTDGSQVIFSKLIVGGETAVGDDAPARPRLLSNYPNPFNPQTVVPCEIPRDGPIRLTVHDLAGRLVAVLVDAPVAAGRHEFVWRGLATDGDAVPSGVYHVRLCAGAAVDTRQVTLVR